MATVPAVIPAVTAGIANLLDGFIVLNEDITETDIVHSIPDQKGAIVAEYPYDKRFDLTLTVQGGGTLPACGATAFQYPTTSGPKWKVEKISKPAVYNDTVKYTITAYRYTNFPSQT